MFAHAWTCVDMGASAYAAGRTEWPLLTAFFSLSLFLSSPPFTFLTGVLHGVLTHKKNKIWGEEKKIGGPPSQLRV